jgi:hypothetical protein
MDDLPLGLRRDRHVELRGQRGKPWMRRVVVALFAAVVVAALVGAFGQQDETVTASASGATLTVRAPERVRGGLFFQGRMDIAARERIRRPRVVLGDGWTEELQLNTLEPAPASESSRDGRLELEYDAIDEGERLTLWLQFEANPTGAGHRDRSVELLDGDRRLAMTGGDLTVLP